jgi:ATP-dependent Clp protease protease subunit
VPIVLENDGKSEHSYDIFSRLLRDRIILINSDFDDGLAATVVAQLLFLNAEDPDAEIQMYINSPGGSVLSGLAIMDTINIIQAPVKMVAMGLAASMGAFLLSCGAKGRRYATKEARIMIHQVSSGARGTVTDMVISMKETEFINERLMAILAANCGKTAKQIKKLADRDLWLSAEEAKEFGLIDEIM